MAAIAGNGVGGSVLSTGVWTGGVVPTAGDTSTFSNGVTYTLANGSTWRVGDSASPTTQAIRTNGAAGTAVFNFDGALEVLGNVLQGNANWTGGAGCSVLFDHASTELTWQITDANSQNRRLVFNGTSVAPCSVSSKAGGANGRFTAGGFLEGGKVAATHTDFTRIGTASNPCMQPRTDFGTAAAVTFADCIFTSCGRLDFPANIPTNATVTFDNCEFRTPLDTSERYCTFTNTVNAVGTGARRFANCYVQGVITFAPNFAWSDVVFDQPSATPRTLASAITRPTLFERVVSRTGGAAAFPITFGPAAIPTPIKDVLVVCSNSNNNRGIQVDIGALTADLTIDGLIAHSEDTNAAHDTGDTINLTPTTALAAARVVTVKNCIQAPKANGYQHGKLVSPLPAGPNGLGNLKVDAEHNTMCTADSVETALQTGETWGANNFGMLYRSVKSNLVLGLGSTGGLGANGGVLLSRYSHAAQQQDSADPAQVQYNWVQNPNGTSVYRVVAGEAAFFTTTPAGPLYTGDAQCVDIYRSHATWDASLGGAGTFTSAMARLSKKTTRSGAGANDTVANLLAYWRGGFAPQNQATVAAHDSANGGTIGAVAYQAGAATDAYIRQQIPHLRQAGRVTIPTRRR